VALAGIPYLLEQVREETGLVPASTETQQTLLHSYIYPIAELMFRQSTLAWVADYCDRTGRKLCLYGNGWDTHPRFARYARGFADNGPQLRAIYQASTVNLQIIGTGAIHQRLLDGLAAGGFFLIRYTPTDVMHEPVRRYLTALRKYDPVLGREYAAGDVPDLVDAVEELCRLRGQDRKFDRITFPVVGSTSYETMEAMNFRRVAGAVFAEYGNVSFASAEEFARLTDRFLSEHDERRRISGSMRAAVVNAHSYGALVDDLLAFVYRRLDAGSGPCAG
jgi:hypothetical protein